MSALAVTVPRQRALRPLRATYYVVILSAAAYAIVAVYNILTDLLAATIPAALDVAPYTPTLNSTLKLDGVSASATAINYDHASMMIRGLGLDTRLWYAGAALSQGLAIVAISLTIALLCRRVERGDPFDAVIPRAFTLSAMAVLVGGFLWQICNQIAGFRVIAETFQPTSGEWSNNVSGITPSSASWPHGALVANISFWPLGVALGLFAIAVVFRYGARLEVERAELKRETEGLV
jgi:hypothetical protein